MPFTPDITAAIEIAVAKGIPFVAYRLPASETVVFFADPGDDYPMRSDYKFAVNSWCAPTSKEYIISDRADVAMILALSPDGILCSSLEVKVWPSSTDRRQYDESVGEVIDYLGDHGGKVVISRTIARTGVSVDWARVAAQYFDAHPEAFCYIYYTPRHGCWLGASPEILLIVNNDKFETMALAGTRTAEEASDQWSGKNIAEQAIVRNYIVDRLYDLGLDPKFGATETVTTGNLQHLCTTIEGYTAGCSPSEIIEAINPTPALAGYPVASALEQIVEHEAHPRRCYGSYVALSTERSFIAYVNLRCVNFDGNGWCMYVGSGIMPDSDPDDEWHETESKARILHNLILDSTR